jgi:ribonuclease R
LANVRKKSPGKTTPKKKTKAKPKTKARPYQHSIPDRNTLMGYLRDVGQPRNADAVVKDFNVRGARGRKQLLDKLTAMVRAGQVIQNRGGEYCLSEKLDLIAGTVSAHKDGFGFVIADQGGDDIYLSAREMRSIFHGDRVAVKVDGADRRGRPNGKLVEVLERGTDEVAGQFIRERGIGIVIPDNPKITHRILIPKGEAGNAKPGQVVVVRILDYPNKFEQPTATVIEVIGDPHQKGIASDIAIHSHEIPTQWPQPVRQQVSKIGDSVPAAAIKNRNDLRELDLVTIDGADARDFDDAVYCEKSGKGWRLLVAIADVAHYVEVGSALDKEAIHRGTSVYFPDRVVPMLPEELSNGLCSLKPKVDRLCMVCEMRVEADGKVSRSKFYEGVMRSSERLTYSQVSKLLTGETDHGIPKNLHGAIHELHGLYEAFARIRQNRGAIELDIPQTTIRLDEHGAVVDISAVPRNDAHRLIEECMIAANVQAAKFLRHHKIAGLYRVHAKPDADKFDELRLYLLTLGLKVPHPDHVQPRDFNRMIQQVKGRPDSAAISMAMLRSLTHAEYTPKNEGHFGLALDAYAHFTSPIRRYPDLLVHRAIRHIVRAGKAGGYEYSADRMERLGSICSAHERRAEEATREVEALLKCQFMEEKIGQQFDGVITGVTNFGVFVQLKENGVDGLVHVSSLNNDYYVFDTTSRTLVGERSGNAYAMGDELQIVVHEVDLETRRIDFRLAADRRGKREATKGRRR